MLTRFFAIALLLLTAALSLSTPARADPEDIAATSRSVVRVVLVARDGDRVFFVGHGSGVMITPDTVLTNAHVVQPTREDSSIVIGIIPSQGSKSYGGKLVAYSPAKDMAVIRLESGRLPPATLYAPPMDDGSNVVAIGYPAAVDRAQGLQLNDLIEPMAPVKTTGVLSGGRTSRDMDTLLHTAPIAAGNSGGPLVDTCGRVIGINSFGSLSNGNDAEYGFAVSAREMMQFLRSAKVEFSTTSAPCRSTADLTREEERRADAAQAQQMQQQRASDVTLAKARADAERQVDEDIIVGRENHIALAAVLLALALAAGGACAILSVRGQRNPAMASGGVAILLLLGALYAFFSRPDFSEREDRIAALVQTDTPAKSVSNRSFAGTNSCTLDQSRSRITVSEQPEISLKWSDAGCVNDRTQYGRDGQKWTRIFVPETEQTVSVNSFDPVSGEFRTERFLLDLDTMDKAREIRSRYTNKSCSPDEAQRASLEDMQKALRQALPPRPNEVLVYECGNSEAEDSE